jgi:transcriptional regulator NrdR family protein
MTCPTCGTDTRVIATRDGYRRRECKAGHRFVTLEQAHENRFPWPSRPKRKRTKKKKKPKRDDNWLERINAKLAESS